MCYIFKFPMHGFLYSGKDKVQHYQVKIENVDLARFRTAVISL